MKVGPMSRLQRRSILLSRRFATSGNASATETSRPCSAIEDNNVVDRHLAMSKMSAQRTGLDFAQTQRWLVDEVYPDARVIHLVTDNLNTHRAASLYEAFGAAEAQCIRQKA